MVMISRANILESQDLAHMIILFLKYDCKWVSKDGGSASKLPRTIGIKPAKIALNGYRKKD
jgi:hypothetical protein